MDQKYILKQREPHYGELEALNGELFLVLTNQNIEGDLEIDAYSSLEVTLANTTIKGKINN